MYPNNKGTYPNKRRTSQNKKKGTYPNKKRTSPNNDGTSSNKNSAYRYKIREADIKNAEILVEVSCYPMTREKFEKLIRSSSLLDDWTMNVLFIGVGFAIKILTVWGIFIFNGYSDENKEKENILLTIESWEYIALVACCAVSGMLKLGSSIWPSKRCKLQREIQDFFKKFE